MLIFISFDLTHLKGYGRSPSKKLFPFWAIEFQEKKNFLDFLTFTK